MPHRICRTVPIVKCPFNFSSDFVNDVALDKCAPEEQDGVTGIFEGPDEVDHYAALAHARFTT
jgi:hypothetical protein